MRHAQRQAVPAFGKTPEHPLLYRDALGEVSGLVDVAAAQDGDLAGEQLQRDARRDGAEHVADCWHADNAVGDLVDLLVALGGNDDMAKSCPTTSRRRLWMQST